MPSKYFISTKSRVCFFCLSSLMSRTMPNQAIRWFLFPLSVLTSGEPDPNCSCVQSLVASFSSLLGVYHLVPSAWPRGSGCECSTCTLCSSARTDTT